MEDDILIRFTPAGKIKILWEGNNRQKSREFLSGGADAFALPLIVINIASEITYSNRAFQKMAGDNVLSLNDSTIANIQSHGIKLGKASDLSNTIAKLLDESKKPHISRIRGARRGDYL